MPQILNDPVRQLAAVARRSAPHDRILVIREDGTAEQRVTELVAREAPDTAQQAVITTDFYDLRGAIVRAARANTWLVADLRADLTADAATTLKEAGRGSVRTDQGETVQLPDGFRFVGIIARAAIERQSYPSFLNLFDSAIVLSR